MERLDELRDAISELGKKIAEDTDSLLQIPIRRNNLIDNIKKLTAADELFKKNKPTSQYQSEAADELPHTWQLKFAVDDEEKRLKSLLVMERAALRKLEDEKHALEIELKLEEKQAAALRKEMTRITFQGDLENDREA